MHVIRQQRPHRDVGGAVKTAALALSIPIGACLMALAMGAADLAWLAWFALVPLFVAIRLWRPPAAMFAGAVWGLSLYLFAGVRPEAAISNTYASLLLLAAIPAAYAYLGARLTRWIGFSPLVLGVGWVAVELALTPLDLHSGLLGAAEGDSTILHWISKTLGCVLVAFLIALVNASLISALGLARLSMPRYCWRIPLAQRRVFPTPRTFFWFPLFAIRPSRPRAPPMPRLA